MKLKRIAAAFLCLVLAVSLISGCNSAEKLDALVTKYNSNMQDVLDDNAKVLNFFKPDLVIMSVDGEDVTWEEFAPWLIFQKNELETALTANNIAMESWDSTYEAMGMTYGEYLLKQTVTSIQSYRAVEKNAAELGIQISEGDKVKIDRAWEQEVSEYEGTEAEYKEYIGNYYGTLELYNYLKNTEALYQSCYKEQFGEGGAKLPASEVLEYVSGEGYMMAKHILITEESVSGENVVDKDAEEFSEQVMDPEADADDADTAEDVPAGTDAEAQPAEDQALALAEDIAGRLAAYSGDDLEGYFDELMAQYNADASENEYFPGGYLFTSGQMVDSFEEAVQSLEEGECSGVVESKYGYHIIMKLPVDVDATPIAFSSYVMNGSEYSLRYIVSMAMFSSVTNGWRENMTVELAEVYGEISPSELFDK